MFDPTTYRTRRQTLAAAMNDGVVLLLGHSNSPMNYEDNYYPFRQDSTFLYFFGLDQPNLAALIDSDTGKNHRIWSAPNYRRRYMVGPAAFAG